MRILTVTHSYGANGAATMLRAAIQHWTADLHWHVDALCRPSEARRFEQELAECGAVPLHSVDLRSYDLILVNTAVDAARIDSLTLNRPSLPIALWVHEGLSVLKHSTDPVSAWLARFSKCRLVIYQTTWQRDEVFKSFAALLPPHRIAVVPSGIEVAPPGMPPRSDTDVFRIVCVASVTGLKRQADLTQVVMKLSGELAIECEFIGSLADAASAGPEVVASIQNPPPALKWVDSLSHAETMKRVSQADLFCLPSSDESCPIAPLEAATRGVPVLLSRLRPYPYIGWRDEVNCLQHRVGDLPGIEARVRRMVSDKGLRQRIGQAGKQLADSLPIEASLETLTQAVSSCAKRS